jgi:Zn-finger nucleic acid-binding protein
MSTIVCPHCGERVFTISSWADVDHCPECGRVLAPDGAIEGKVREQIQREAGRFRQPGPLPPRRIVLRKAKQLRDRSPD